MGTDQHPEAPALGLFQLTAAKYGIGQWAQCPKFVSLVGGDFSTECANAKISGSLGLSGTFPIVDRNLGYHMYFGYSGIPIIGAAISAVFSDTLKPLVDAAFQNSTAVYDLPTEIPVERVNCLLQLTTDAYNLDVQNDEQLDAFIKDRVC
jgi:hypothetical protein